MADISAAVGDFLEVAINHLLFLRGLYPAGARRSGCRFLLLQCETYHHYVADEYSTACFMKFFLKKSSLSNSLCFVHLPVWCVLSCAEVFARTRFASVPVYCARHPALRAYIHNAVNDIVPCIKQVG